MALSDAPVGGGVNLKSQITNIKLQMTNDVKPQRYDCTHAGAGRRVPARGCGAFTSAFPVVGRVSPITERTQSWKRAWIRVACAVSGTLAKMRSGTHAAKRESGERASWPAQGSTRSEKWKVR